MSMFRIKCSVCSWGTMPHYLQSDCIREKEHAHYYKIWNSQKAHDLAFEKVCPKCGNKTIDENRYFSDEEIKRIKEGDR